MNSNKLFVYILKLQKNKYYVGKSINPINRLNNHFNNKGSAWTKKYQPLEVVKVIENCDKFDEDKFTLKYMDKYGIDNVRGGTFSQINLDETTYKFINLKLATANDYCFKCGKTGHFAKNCTNFYKTNKETVCFRCGRSNHNCSKCYAFKDIWGL